ncbi:MAG: hypothetical protein F9K24_07125 [Leptonema illini]|uniref:Lipoprotein n=1 Tax=Leptonema illini TaxID=183 RepID=A0A833LZ77_9LEPT|nr:MAG: hypothetical protein F9K24_07125 [Leptonema illini]
MKFGSRLVGQSWLVAFLLLSSCDVREILPNDLSDPEHARYVASGDKDKDRQQFEAYLLLCPQILQPVFDAYDTECRLKYPTEDCSNDWGQAMSIVACAAALVDYHPGARSDEFNNSESY